ncbi:MAG TPA: hypothetical protein VGN04_10430 [Herbaspirillum sp.]|jgi:hypothetical protein
MSLIGGRTRWVLFLSANGDADTRHIQDLAFGLTCLESAGINIVDIDIYVDGSDRTSVENFIKSGTASACTVKTSQDFLTDQANNSHDNLVMFVTGHGGPDGLDALPVITPDALLKGIKESPNLKLAVIYLGQCYAGIFNYIGAGSKKPDDPQVIFIGATNLHESVSRSTSETLVTGQQQWPANLFLLYAFKWFQNPTDVDGDGKFTIIDSYKYAGTHANIANKRGKMQAFHDTPTLRKRWEDADAAHRQNPTPTNKANLDASVTRYEKHIDILYIHQECWILNAIPAQLIER